MPVSVARLRELIDLVAAQGVESLDAVEGGTRIQIRRIGNAVAGRPGRVSGGSVSPEGRTPIAASPSAQTFAAPMFGVFHITSAPGARPYVAVGDHVSSGQQLCLIEAMKMFNPILSDRDGRVEAVLAEPGAEVATGQPLFRIVVV